MARLPGIALAMVAMSNKTNDAAIAAHLFKHTVDEVVPVSAIHEVLAGGSFRGVTQGMFQSNIWVEQPIRGQANERNG